MVPESQFDGWRKDLVSNVRKAGEALKDDDQKRFQLATMVIEMTGRVMMAERVGMLALALNRNDEVLGEVMDRLGSGEKIVERMIMTLEGHEADLPEEVEVGIALMESWLHPETVQFTPPDKS